MTDNDRIVSAAIAIGFTVSDHDELKCTHEQLVEFAAQVASAAITQVLDIYDAKQP